MVSSEVRNAFAISIVVNPQRIFRMSVIWFSIANSSWQHANIIFNKSSCMASSVHMILITDDSVYSDINSNDSSFALKSINEECRFFLMISIALFFAERKIQAGGLSGTPLMRQF